MASKTQREVRERAVKYNAQGTEEQTYKSPLGAALHESMEDLHQLGLADQATMRRFDEAYLVPVPTFGGEEIRALRDREKASQAVFARYLGVSLNTVGQWERGERKATGAAAKLLSLVQAHGLAYIR